ncbi:hypothetical protein BDW69DRAFT_73742 [Aspergillus filifer]
MSDDTHRSRTSEESISFFVPIDIVQGEQTSPQSRHSRKSAKPSSLREEFGAPLQGCEAIPSPTSSTQNQDSSDPSGMIPVRGLHMRCPLGCNNEFVRPAVPMCVSASHTPGHVHSPASVV